MPLRLVPFTADEAPAAREFNARVTGCGAQMEFLLPEEPPASRQAADTAIRSTHFLALDGEFARGGCVLVDLPGWLDGCPQPVVNCQSPLSEGSADRRYGFVGAGIMKFIQRQSRYVFALGMGNDQTAWARLLKAFGWSLRPVPFFFRVVRADRFLRNIQPLRASGSRRFLAKLAARTGMGGLGFGLMHSRALVQQLSSRSLTVELVPNWGSWADALWQDFREDCSFAVVRNRQTLEELYPASETRILRFLVRSHGRPVVWLTALNTRMSGDRYFGDLQVATILDLAGQKNAMPGAVALCSAMLASEGADLIISNQSHHACIKALHDAGFIQSASNYFLGVSKDLDTAITRHPGGYSCAHLTRGDADGRIHL